MGRRKSSSSLSIDRPKLQNHLFLFSYMNHLFGMNSFEDKVVDRTRVSGLKFVVENVKDGYGDDGRSYMLNTLSLLKGVDKHLLQKLEEYDQNIKGYVDRINAYRQEKVTLKYFQYLSILYTEIFLDRYFSDPNLLAGEINEYVLSIFNDVEAVYSLDDLRKLAYMMATGSGKTLLMHINLLQFKRYNKGPNRIEYDNILLITPNANMSKQHMMQLRLSGIEGEHYKGNGGYFSNLIESDIVKIIDINKFTKDKRNSDGVSVDIESFGNKNLIFVDEGHKGVASGDTWVKYRNQLSEEGFTFEYSATFSQAVSVVSKHIERNEMLHVYGKSIIFDYSYKYFHQDGYGKDYLIMNLSDASYADHLKNVLMMGNLLTFYEQKLLYDTMKSDLNIYNIDNPLWVFVGSKVSGKQQESDIFEIVKFIDSTLRNENGWAIKTIDDIISGRSGLQDQDGKDIFAISYPEHRLAYLREQKISSIEIYKDILMRIFHSNVSAPLQLFNLKGAESQIGMKCGNNSYFGLIMVSDDTGLINLISSRLKEVKTSEDNLSRSLFDIIDNHDSGLNLLVGAKMFMEGWSSWRVSCMGLMYVGQNEGVQIIQMFGRGVRLKGKDHTLKRSSVLECEHPRYLPLLEMLNVFGIEANYMLEFKEMLGVEGLSPGKITYTIPIKLNKEFYSQQLLVPDVDKTRYAHECLFSIDAKKVSVTVDLTPIIEVIFPEAKSDSITSELGSQEVKISHNLIEAIDWQQVYLKLLEYRSERKWNNIIFSAESLKNIIKDDKCYTLKCPKKYLNPLSFEEIKLVESVIVTVLKKYLEKFYTYERNQWVKNNLELKSLTDTNGNFSFSYQVKVYDNEFVLRDNVESLIQDHLDELYRGQSNNILKNIFLDRHLYQPLIALNVLQSGIIEVHPQGLNPGEQRFVSNVKKYIEYHKEETKDLKLYILRNLPKRGIGFFDLTNYYPDFILWLIKDGIQHILFVDPKGLIHMLNGFDEEEIKLFNTIKAVEKRCASSNVDQKITLDSFIISVTSKQETDKLFSKGRSLTYEDYRSHHILFEEDEDYIGSMFKMILTT